MDIPPAVSLEAFYRAGLEGLRFLEAREARGRRFGEAADAAWRALGGELEATDRLDLLLRDAAASHALAFAPRNVFDLHWLPEDEPFGSEWPGARAALAEGLVREGKTSGEAELPRLLAVTAKHWGLPEPKIVPGLADQAARIGPASRFLITGVDALFAVAQATAGRRDLDLAEQAVVLAEGPAERQLWGLTLLGSPTRTRPRVISAKSATADAVRGLGMSRLDFALVADGASEGAKAAARAVLETLRG